MDSAAFPVAMPPRLKTWRAYVSLSTKETGRPHDHGRHFLGHQGQIRGLITPVTEVGGFQGKADNEPASLAVAEANLRGSESDSGGYG